MRVSLLVAVSENGVIGRDNQLLWHLPDDLKRFKSLTMGNPILMGRKTFDSIGRPLPGRTNIVITRSEKFEVPGVIKASSLLDAVRLAKMQDSEKAFIIGGGEIYRQAIDKMIVDDIYLTKVHTIVNGDTFFEIPDATNWEIVKEVSHAADERHAFAFNFIDLTSRKNIVEALIE